MLATGAAGEGDALLKKRPRTLRRGVAVTAGDGAAATVAAGCSTADDVAFWCERLLLAGDTDGDAALAGAAGDCAALAVDSAFLWLRLAGDGVGEDESALTVLEAAASGGGESFALRLVRCFAGEGDAVGEEV